MAMPTGEQLKKKLTDMPIVTTNIRKIKSKKDGREWYVLETRITRILSPLYMERVMKGLHFVVL